MRMEEKKTKRDKLREFLSDNMDIVWLGGAAVVLIGTTAISFGMYNKHLCKVRGIYEKELRTYYENLIRKLFEQ